MEPSFEKGDDAAIKRAKADYRRQYKARWKKEKRKVDKEITTSWTKTELKELTIEAKRHSLSLAGFIKQSVLAYMSKSYLVANKKEVDKILQLVGMMYNRIENLVDEQSITRVMGIEIKEELYKLEREVRIQLISPYTLEQTIQNHLQNKPEAKTQLLNFIQSLES